MKTMHYAHNQRLSEASICNRIHDMKSTIRCKLSQVMMAAALFIVTSSASAAPPPPPTGLCISTPSGSGCAPTIQPPQQTGATPPSMGNNTTPPPQLSGNSVKWHPGHYMLAYLGAPQSDFDIMLNEPNIKGVQVRYFWSDLEPKKGQYDFSQIESDLAYLQASGKRLVAMVMERSFTLRKKPLPNYLLTTPVYNGGAAPSKNGTIARLWERPVMDRLIALYQALGARFNNEPYFEAISVPETSPGFRGNNPPGYSPAKWASELKRGMTALKTAFPNTVVLQSANSLGGSTEIPGIIDHAYNIGIGVQGPDLYVNPGKITAAQQYRMAKYLNKMPMSDLVSFPVLCGRAAYPAGATCTSLDTIFNQGVNVFKNNYIFWIRNGSANGASYAFSPGIISTINKYGGKINSKCPQNIGSCNTQ